jgi:hypothetical protein
MNEEMDAADVGSCKLLGRWHNLGCASGHFFCESPDAVALGSWLQNWISTATCKVVPVVDDNQARKIILKGEEPSFHATFYDKVGDEAPEGYSLYFIDVKIPIANRAACWTALASMTEEVDKADYDKCVLMGRYHNLGNGTGFIICAAKSEVDLMAWAYNWTTLFDFNIQPVMSDNEVREMVKSKPNFAIDLIKFKASMGMP